MYLIPPSSRQLVHDQSMMASDTPVNRAQRNTPCEAVGNEEAVEGIARPCEPQTRPDERHQRNIIHAESGIVHDRVGELGIPDGESPDLRQELDLQERNRGHTPGPVPIEPRERGETSRSEGQPEQEVRIEEEGHRARARRAVSGRLGPRQSHDHRSASSASGTRIRRR